MPVLPTTTYKVRIVCRTFNQAQYIEDAMNGFCIQETKFPFVAIIIDDASTDGEPEIISQYLENHFDMVHAQYDENDDAKRIATVHKNNPNCHFLVILLKYNFCSINKAQYPLYKGWYENVPYIAICEGDDYWTDPYKLQKQVDFLETHPDYNVCSHDFFCYEQNDLKHHAKSFYYYLFSANNEKDYFDYSLDIYFEGWWTHPLSCMYRNGQYLKDIPYIQYKNFRDDILFYYILKEGKGALLHDIMATYRVHNNGIWTKLNFYERKDASMNNAYNIYLVEHDRNAFKKILRIQYEVLMQLKKEGKKKEYFIKIIKYLKMDPWPFSSNLIKSIIRSNFNIIYKLYKSFFEH